MPILRFEVDEPVVVSLADAGGKTVEGRGGPQVMYRTTGGDLFYASLDLDEAIRGRGIRSHQQIQICKRKRGRYVNWEIRTEAAGAVGAAPTGMGVANQSNPSYPMPGQPANGPQAVPVQAAAMPAGQTHTSREVMGCLYVAIDALVEAKTYAASRGIAVQFGGQDIRAIANTLLMERAENARAKRRAA